MAVGKILILESVSAQPKQLQAADTAYGNLFDTAASGVLSVGGTNCTQVDIASGAGQTALNLGRGVAVDTIIIGGAAATAIQIGTGMGAGDAMQIGANALATFDLLGAAINIGNAADTAAVVIKGNLTVNGTETVIGTSEFDDDAVFKGNITFGDGLPVPPHHDSVTFASGTEITSDMVFGSAARSIKGGAPAAGGAGYQLSVLGGDATGAGPSVGGDLVLQAGNAVGISAGGKVSIKGGGPGTAVGGAIEIIAANSTLGSGAYVQVTAGSAAGSGPYYGGSVLITAGNGVADAGSPGGDVWLQPGVMGSGGQRQGMVVFGDFTNRFQTDYVPIFAKSKTGSTLDDTLAGLAWNQPNNAWYYKNQGGSWTPLTGTGVLPSGSTNQLLEHNGSAWVAVNDITLANTGTRRVKVDAVTSGNGVTLNIAAGLTTEPTNPVHGGYLSVAGGAASSVASGDGGYAEIAGGAGGASGNGGAVLLKGGAAGGVGDVYIQASGLYSGYSFGPGTGAVYIGFRADTANWGGIKVPTSGAIQFSDSLQFVPSNAGGVTRNISAATSTTGNGDIIAIQGGGGAASSLGGNVEINGGAKGSGGAANGYVKLGQTLSKTQATWIGNSASGNAAIEVINATGSTSEVHLGAAGLWDDVGAAGNVKLSIGKTTDTVYPLYANLGGSPTYLPGIRYDTGTSSWQVQTNTVAWSTLATGTSFTAGGDLSGTASNQTVIGIRTVPVSSTPPSITGQLLTYTTSGGGQWYAALPGNLTKNSFGALTAGQALCMYNDSGTIKVTPADASGAGAYHNCVGFASTSVLTNVAEPVITSGTTAIAAALWDGGVVPAATDVGKQVYNSPTTAGNVTITPFTTSGKFIQKVGIVTDAAGGILVQIGDVIAL